jgi:peroxiredoxin
LRFVHLYSYNPDPLEKIMRTALLSAAVSLAIAVGFVSPLFAQASFADLLSEAQFRQISKVDDSAKVIYRDVDGKELDFRAFITKSASGNRLNIGAKEENKETNTVTFTVKSAQQSDAAASDQPPAKQSEAEFRQQMLLDDMKEVTYYGTDGKQIDFDTFIAQMSAGGVSFSKTFDTEKKTASIHLTPITAEQRERFAKMLTGALAGSSQKTDFGLSVAVGSAMPVLGHASLDGKRFNLADGEHYSLLSFFFAQCVPCVQEIPDLNALHAQSPDLQTISITFDDKDTAKEFIAKRGLQWPVVSDAKDYIDQLGIKGYPTLVAVSPEGKLLGVRTSYVMTGDKEKQLADLKAWLDSVGVKR